MSTPPAPMWRPEHAGDPAAALDLLRHYEPVLVFTEGEMFLPMDVEEYVKRCSLHERLDDGKTELLARAGELTLERLENLAKARFDRPLFMRFVQQPLDAAALREWNSRRPSSVERRQPSSTGLLGRAGEALARTSTGGGREDEGIVAAAQLQYADTIARTPHFTYYGLVKEEGDYTVLSYYYFYAMSDWRSSFFGAGDHGGDWQQVVVYLAPVADGYLEPAWVACESGGVVDVRSWDRPGLSRIDTHPQLFVAAGSHAAYFAQGDYLTSSELEVGRPLSEAADAVASLWRRIRSDNTRDRRPPAALTVPFVDYARGNGVRIGAGQATQWDGIIIDDGQAWIDAYHGTWGPDRRTAFAASQSSSGPKYDRAGRLRESWSDPVRWAGLDRHPPPAMVDAELSRRIEVLEHDAEVSRENTQTLRSALPQMTLEIEALEATDGVGSLLTRRRQQLERVEAEIEIYDTRRADDLTSAEACRNLQRRRLSNDAPQGPATVAPRPSRSLDSGDGRSNDLVAGLLAAAMVLVAIVLLLAGSPWYAVLALLLVGALVVDSVLRDTVASFMGNLAVVLAVATGIVLVYEVFWPLTILALVVVGAFLLMGDVKEIRGR